MQQCKTCNFWHFFCYQINGNLGSCQIKDRANKFSCETNCWEKEQHIKTIRCYWNILQYYFYRCKISCMIMFFKIKKWLTR